MLESVRGDVLTKCVRNTPKYSGFHSCKYVRPAYKFYSKMGLLVGLILTSMVGLQVWWLRSMVGADADPPTAHGRCWVTAEQLGMWPLDHGCCSFIPRRKIKTFFANAVELVV